MKTDQHSGAEVELVEELRDEDVHFEHVRHILPLDFPQLLDKPLELSVCGTDPQEIYLQQLLFIY